MKNSYLLMKPILSIIYQPYEVMLNQANSHIQLKMLSQRKNDLPRQFGR
ncbi:hypothetical protein [Francisella sp. SYW-2]|nr:hypothetical protein [Francisella sp. SYW-2]